MSYYYNSAPSSNGYVNAEPAVIYGYPVLPDQYNQYNLPQPTQAPVPGYLVTTAEVAIPAECDELGPLPRLYDSESDFFDGIIEILGDSDCDKNNVAIASSMAIPTVQGTTEPVYSGQPVIPALSCYAVPEATRIEDLDDKFEYDINDFPADCVAAFDSMDLSDNAPTNSTHTYPIQVEETDKKPATNELFCVGTIDIDYLKSLNDADEKRIRRKEAINRWKLKKLKKKSVIKAVKHSVSTLSEGAAAACNTLLNPRQKATAKRERENGKFKKAQVQWVSVTDLFNSTFDDFK